MESNEQKLKYYCISIMADAALFCICYKNDFSFDAVDEGAI
jgi:hypothetical protein